MFRPLLLLFAGLLALSPAIGRAAAPRRIVSLNLCADQYLLALADPGQIAGLTEWARDPDMSYYAAKARMLPFTHRTAEEVLTLRPDLVIGAPFVTRHALAPLQKSGVPMIDLPFDDSLASIEASVRQVAAAVGHRERGEAMIATMHADLARIGPPPGRGRVAAYYQRQGYLTGTGTLVDEMMRRAGLVNLASRLGRPSLSQLPLEVLAMARPDFLIVEARTDVVADKGSEMLHHPLLDRVVAPGHRLTLPQAMTVCGGPFYPQAVAALAAQVRAAL
ncbi:ABC transporter substrate-binding protein [Sphingomonas sp. PR090111-T3T-6A]|uniref:ABC transporter substrate-binding protein n=1 Tax=Sphingomonas sp. PR090111-T3T-6A TaxID=685778 RepID=UPI00039D4F0C|nr:ABC transporter substrate-binding protein [Sphingomonas sp. PR090111-T3T-6A]